MDSEMEEAPPKLDSKNPESIKEFIQFLQAKATKLTDELFNAAFAPSTDESEKDDSAREVVSNHRNI
jgi:cation transport regulator ChaB